MVSFDRDVVNVFVWCYDYYQQNRSFPDKLRTGAFYEKHRQKLRQMLLGLAQTHESLYSGWEVDNQNPGYLIRADPPIVMRVPVHLAPIFPSESQLEELWSLAKLLKMSPDSVICLSGSNALKRMLTRVGDVDYCEYVFLPSDSFLQRLQNKLQPSEENLCISARIAGSQWRIDEGGDLEAFIAAAQLAKPDHPDLSGGKMDYISALRLTGAIETSNVLIFCDRNGASASLPIPFAAQEAPMGAANFIPNDLSDPAEMGRYIDWLLGQIRYYVEAENHSKALKRALSLARVCHLKDYADQIFRIVSSARCIVASEEEHLSALVDRLKVLPEFQNGGGLLKGLQQRLLECQGELARLGHTSIAFEESARLVAANLIAEIEDRAFTGIN